MTRCTAPDFTLFTDYAARPVTSLTSYAAEDAAPAGQGEQAELPPYWTGVIGVEGQLTGDGRLIEMNALEWETPIPLRFVAEDIGAHQGAATSGRILSITREDDGKLRAWGDFDHGSDAGREAARLVVKELMNGVSMDLDSVAFEVRVAAEIIEAERALWDAIESGEDIEPPAVETDDEGRVVVYKGGPDDEVMVTTSARVRAATQVSIPAFAEATIEALYELPEPVMALVASAAPVDPPAAWFAVAEPDGPTPLTITDDGMVYGHLATWDTCHIADPNGSGICVMAPKSQADYAYFHTGAVKTAEGSLVNTGVLRFNTQHASLRASADAAQAHYDHTGLGGADIHAIDGKHGVWVCGALRPGLEPEQIRTLRASPLSGDWRYVNGSLELVGALAVNLPGFPVPRPSGLVASGEMTGLVAAGMIAPRGQRVAKQFSDADAEYLRQLVARGRRSEASKLHARANELSNRRKVEKMAASLATTPTAS